MGGRLQGSRVHRLELSFLGHHQSPRQPHLNSVLNYLFKLGIKFNFSYSSLASDSTEWIVMLCNA